MYDFFVYINRPAAHISNKTYVAVQCITGLSEEEAKQFLPNEAKPVKVTAKNAKEAVKLSGLSP